MMMKRLLALMLVLAVTSSANALFIQIDGVSGESAEVVEGATSAITVVSEDESSWLGYLVIEEGGTGSLSNAVILNAAGNMAAATPYTEAGWGNGYELTAAMSPGGDPAIAAGSQFSFDYSGGILGENAHISLFLSPEYDNPVSSVSVSVIPEPITIALLGFGALLLYRRK
jgi:hypothetical protein